MDQITQEHYAYAAANAPVSANPTLSTNPFFTIAIKHELEPYAILDHLKIDVETDDEVKEKKMWTWRRFGQTCTELPDGRKIYIGGEYDDWCVYPLLTGSLLI